MRDRHEVAILLREHLDEFKDAPTRELKQRSLRRFVDLGRPERPFAGMVRSLCAQWFRTPWRTFWAT